MCTRRVRRTVYTARGRLASFTPREMSERIVQRIEHKLLPFYLQLHDQRIPLEERQALYDFLEAVAPLPTE